MTAVGRVLLGTAEANHVRSGLIAFGLATAAFVANHWLDLSSAPASYVFVGVVVVSAAASAFRGGGLVPCLLVA